MMNDFVDLTLVNAAERVNNQEVNSKEIVEFFLDEIKERNKRTNSYIRVLDEQARRRASLADRRARRGENLPLNGVPIAVKDLFDMRGVPTTCGSLAMKDYIPSNNSIVIQRLLDAGAIILGKLNLHEFAFGSTSENVKFGNVRNPWNTSCIAGGSSGGSAAAVADGLCLGSLGSDTGGSVRIPAALCGVVGFKPTAGCVNLGGIFPLSWTLDNVGTLAKNVRDCGLLLSVILDPAKKRKIDSTISNNEASRKRQWNIGVVDNFPVLLQEEVESSYQEACAVIGGFVKNPKKFEMPFPRHYKTIADLIMTCEACSIHEKLLSARFENYSREVRTKIVSGNFISSTEYLQAIKLKKNLTNILITAMSKFDLLVLPTTPITATRVGKELIMIRGKRYGVKQILGILTRPFSLCGLPALSIPCGIKNGLPIGLQIVGKPYYDNLVLAIAEAYERARGPLPKKLGLLSH